MSRSRGHGNVFIEGTENDARILINSKRADLMFIVNFLQRRMNTSYQKVLYCNRYSIPVRVRERWDVRTHEHRYGSCHPPYKYPQSVIELFIEDAVIGRAYADGSVWLAPEMCIDHMKWRMRRAIEKHLSEAYHKQGEWYTLKSTQRVVPPVATQVSVQDGFADVMNREWRM